MEQVGNYGYSTGGYTIEGLNRLQNTNHDLRDGKVKKHSKYANRYSEEIRQEVLRLKKENVLSVRQIAEKVGISWHTCRSICFRKRELHPKAPILTEEQQKKILEAYPTTSNNELAKQFGCSYKTIIRLAERHNVKKDKDYKHDTMCNNLIHKRTMEARIRAGKTVKEIREREKRRILYGLPQQTKLLIGHNRKKTQFKANLKHRCGYFTLEYASSTLYYDEHTRRSMISEQRAKEYGIEIKEYSNML